MPGQSPRIKAKKGIFGLGRLDPVLLVNAFPTTVTTGVADTSFDAEASDDVDGDITATIDWYSDLDAASVGTGGTPSITLTAVGTHKITVTATATTGGATDTQEVEVEVTP